MTENNRLREGQVRKGMTNPDPITQRPEPPEPQRPASPEPQRPAGSSDET